MDTQSAQQLGRIEEATRNLGDSVKRVENVVTGVSDKMNHDSKRLRDAEERIRDLAKWQDSVRIPLQEAVDMNKKVRFSISVMKWVGTGTGILIIKTVIDFIKHLKLS